MVMFPPPTPSWMETTLLSPPPPKSTFLFLGFQLPMISFSLEILNGNFTEQPPWHPCEKNTQKPYGYFCL